MNTAVITHWNDYLELCKPKVVALIVFTAVVGMFLSVPGMVPLDADVTPFDSFLTVEF